MARVVQILSPREKKFKKRTPESDGKQTVEGFAGEMVRARRENFRRVLLVGKFEGAAYYAE